MERTKIIQAIEKLDGCKPERETWVGTFVRKQETGEITTVISVNDTGQKPNILEGRKFKLGNGDRILLKVGAKHTGYEWLRVKDGYLAHWVSFDTTIAVRCAKKDLEKVLKLLRIRCQKGGT